MLLENPQAYSKRQEDVYRNLMTKEYEKEASRRMGEARAGLGNRYHSTFGQLTMGGLAQEQGLNRARLEADIYDSGQNAYDRLLNRATGTGNLYSQGYDQMLKPYTTLGQLTGTVAPGVTGYNQAQVQNYAASRYKPQSSGGGSNGLATAASIIGNIAPMFF